MSEMAYLSRTFRPWPLGERTLGTSLLNDTNTISPWESKGFWKVF